MFIIYKHTNKITGKAYIGFTKFSIEKRWKQHCKAVNAGSELKFHRAIRKHGSLNDIWDHQVIDIRFSEEQAKLSEIALIKHFDTFKNGYNLTFGGQGNSGNRSNETKRKISKANKGRKLSEETRKRMSESQRGNKNFLDHKHSLETKLKISDANKGKNSHRKGIKLTKEIRKRMSKAQKGRIFSKEHKKKLSESKKNFYAQNRHQNDNLHDITILR